MDGIRRQLDESRHAMEKLQADYRVKIELFDILMKSHNEQMIKFQEAEVEIEKQALELNRKNEELSHSRQMCEDLQHSLHEKESILKHLTSTQDHLRASLYKKVEKLETENKELLTVLDEVNAKTEDQEKKIAAYKEEIAGLKGLLSVSQRKCLDAEHRAKAPEELKQRDHLLLQFELENGKLEDQLKWKNEQFQHLEEAYGKLQNQFQTSWNEWETEKTTLLDEISSSQEKLESQTRVLEGVQSQLKMCNSALAQEESRRKLLENQLNESKAQYESIAAEYQDARSAIESLTERRDEEIAMLRNTLAKKENLFKEMEYGRAHLEQDNRDLNASLKELQEAQISQAGSAASISKLRQKLRGLEQVHKGCSTVLQKKEAEWHLRLEAMEKELAESHYELELRHGQIKNLLSEVERYSYLLEQQNIQNEELSITLMVLESELQQLHSQPRSSFGEREPCNERAKEQIAILREQLNQKTEALVIAEAQIEQERKVSASLGEKFESVEQVNLLRENDLQRYKEMLKESLNCQNQTKEEKMERDLADDLRKVSEVLDKANSDLAEAEQRKTEMNYELLRWKTIAEQLEISKLDGQRELNVCLEKNQEVLRDLEAAALSNAKAQRASMREKNKLLQIIQEKDKQVDDLQQEIAFLKEESIRREVEAIILSAGKAERTFSEKIHRLMQFDKEKGEKISDLELKILMLQQELTRNVNIANTFVAEKQSEINSVYGSWEKYTASSILSQVQVHYMELLISGLEEEIRIHKQKLDLAIELEAELRMKLLSEETGKDQLKDNLELSGALIEKLRDEIKGLVGTNMRLSQEKNELLDELRKFSSKMEELLCKDSVAVRSLERLVLYAGSEDGEMEAYKEDEVASTFKNGKNILLPIKMTEEKGLDSRPPLKDLNC